MKQGISIFTGKLFKNAIVHVTLHDTNCLIKDNTCTCSL
jgi:hypothetical protein